MLTKIVTAKYEPEVPNGREYVPRRQDNDLKEKLAENIASETHFFMLIGESGSGKTTMMQHLLKNNYKEGVIFVAVNAGKLVGVDTKALGAVVEEAVLDQFGECKNHPRRQPGFINFIKHANEVRKKAKGEKAHPLIIYITLDTKDDSLSYKTMRNIAVAVGGMASDLSSKLNVCKTIVEFSKTGISDALRGERSDFGRLEVGAMTEDEFLKIGKQMLLVKGFQNPEMSEAEIQAVKDPQKLAEPYLMHYHDWLGGHTKNLVSFIERNEVKSKIASATAETKDKVLEQLKEDIDKEFKASVKQLRKAQPEEINLLKSIAETGVKGFFTDDSRNRSILSELMNRDSKLTLLCKVDKNSVRIHRYSHALYLHDVKEPTDKEETKIKKVKEKYEMKAKSA